MSRVSINIATHKQRRGVLSKCLRALHNQSRRPDVIRVFCNDYKPDLSLEDRFPLLELYHSEQDYTDRAKFLWVEQGGIYFSFDDDILAPPNYVSHTLQALEKYPNAIVSYHGRKLKGKGLNYYFGHRQFHCLRTVEHDTMIDIPGSGVSAWNTDKFMPDVSQYSDDCMADVLLGLEAAKAGVKVICLAHDTFWLRSLWNPNKGSIYQQERDSCDRQSELADVIWDLKY